MKADIPTVDQYLAQFEIPVRTRLETLRALFMELAPAASESIRYNMPAYGFNGSYLYYAAYKKHIGFYPIYGMDELENELKPYRAKSTKDSLHFLHSQDLPISLISKIIRYRLNTKARD